MLRFETDPDLAAIDRVSCSTSSIVDRKLVVAMIRYGESCGKRDDAIRIIARKRREWLTWLTMSQRMWQAHTRRPSRARHHDSIEIRERYVRCGPVAS